MFIIPWLWTLKQCFSTIGFRNLLLACKKINYSTLFCVASKAFVQLINITLKNRKWSNDNYNPGINKFSTELFTDFGKLNLVKIGYRGLVLNWRQFSILPQLPHSKVVESDSKIIIIGLNPWYTLLISIKNVPFFVILFKKKFVKYVATCS